MRKFIFLGMSLIFLMLNQNVFAKKVPTPDTPPKGVKIASAEDVQKIIDQGGIIYDVRWHYSEYVLEGHIPTAVSVPYTEWSAKSVDYNPKEDSWDFSALPKDKNTPMAFYCMGVNCWKSYKIADQVAKLGYKNVYWYKGGQPEWDALGLPVEGRNEAYHPLATLFSSGEPLSWLIEPSVLKQYLDNNHKMQIIDLRYKSFFEEGRIKGAFQVDLKDLLSRDGIQLMPKPGSGSDVVLVSENGQTASMAAVALAQLGFDVKVLNGGMKAWNAKYKDQYSEKGKHAVNVEGGSGWKGQLFKLPKGK
jgi:rhodanese-related sulfurtransferase